MGAAATVVGASGFIGGRLAARLAADRWEVFAPERGEEAELLERDLGCVFYCAGLTADFDQRPFETVEAHVGLLAQLLRAGRFERLIYLSSTRLYDGLAEGHEDAPLALDPANPRHSFDLSKALGENLVMTRAGGRGRVARLANIYDWTAGSPGFLSDWLIRARAGRDIALASSPGAARDYVHLDDAVTALIAIAESSAQIVNVASGALTSNTDIAAVFLAAGWRVSFAGEGPPQPPPDVDVGRLAALGVSVRPVKDVVKTYLESLA
jgi:nucleoside-diphosphate-sugar epimerase